MKKSQQEEESKKQQIESVHHTRSHDPKPQSESVEEVNRDVSNPHLTHDQRVEIHTLFHQAGWSIPQIMDKLHVSYPTVQHWVKANEFDDKPHTGRPFKYSPEILVELLRNHQEWSLEDCRNAGPSDDPNGVPSLSTLYEMYSRLPFQTVTNKPHHVFTSKQLQDRVDASRIHKGPRKGHSVFFVDETSIGRKAHTHRLHVFADDTPHYQELRAIKGFTGHFFAGICYYGRTELVSFDKKLDSKDYQLILENM